MSPCHILAHACATIKHKLLFNLRSSNMLAQGIFFLTAIFLQLIDDGLIFLLPLAHCLRRDRDQSLKARKGCEE